MFQVFTLFSNAGVQPRNAYGKRIPKTSKGAGSSRRDRFAQQFLASQAHWTRPISNVDASTGAVHFRTKLSTQPGKRGSLGVTLRYLRLPTIFGVAG